jgi:hypothetical protein
LLFSRSLILLRPHPRFVAKKLGGFFKVGTSSNEVRFVAHANEELDFKLRYSSSQGVPVIRKARPKGKKPFGLRIR